MISNKVLCSLCSKMIFFIRRLSTIFRHVSKSRMLVMMIMAVTNLCNWKEYIYILHILCHAWPYKNKPWDISITRHNVSCISLNYIFINILRNGDIFVYIALKSPAWMNLVWIWPIGNRAVFSTRFFAAVVGVWPALSDSLFLLWVYLNVCCVSGSLPVFAMAPWNQHRIFL